MKIDIGYETAKKCYQDEQYEEAIRLLLESAQNGNIRAQNDLGVCYEKTGDYLKAAFWYSVASMVGEDISTINLANYYLVGRGIAQNVNYALKLYQEVATKGNYNAYYKLGMTYLEGKYVKQDYKKAYSFFLKGAKIEREKDEAGICINKLGYMNHLAYGKVKNDKLAIKYYLEAAKIGNNCAQFNLGQCYLFGHGCDEDIEQALYWFNQSAKTGSTSAMIKLSELYAYGKVVEKNKDIALTWIKEAVNQYDPRAYIKSAEYFLTGDIVEKDLCRATRFLKYYKEKLADEESEKMYNELKKEFKGYDIWQDVENMKGELA